MNYIIITISIKKFFVILMLWVLVSVSAFMLWSKYNDVTELDRNLVVGWFVTIFISGLLIALKFSKEKTNLSLTETNLEFNGYNIKLKDIEGYYIHRTGLVMTQIEFKDATRNYKITSAKFGKDGREFEFFLTDLINKFAQTKTDVKKLIYFDFHKKEYSRTKTFLPITFVIIIIFDVFFFYQLATHRENLSPWKIIFLNILFLSQFSFYKRNSKTKE